MKQLFVVLLMALPLGCGPSHLRFEDLQTSATQKFFNYPYKSSPQFYGRVGLYAPIGAANSFEKFKFIGSVANPDHPSAPISYLVRIQTTDGQTLCPEHSGKLSDGKSTIEFECSPALTSAGRTEVQMEVSSGRARQVFQKVY